MTVSESLCCELATILKGEGHVENNICSVMSHRKDLNVRLLGHQIHSLENMYTFEPVGDTEKYIILSEVVLLENEVPYVASSLYNQGITVSAIHNHWLGDQPHLIYVHFQALMEPLVFAKKVAFILNSLE